jgi:hypothetical protein
VAIAEDDTRPEACGDMETITALVWDLDVSTAESRSRAVSEVFRVGGTASSATIAESTNWQPWVSAIAMATTTTSEDQQGRIRSALTKGYQSVSAFWSEHFAGSSICSDSASGDHETWTSSSRLGSRTRKDAR